MSSLRRRPRSISNDRKETSLEVSGVSIKAKASSEQVHPLVKLVALIVIAGLCCYFLLRARQPQGFKDTSLKEGLKRQSRNRIIQSLPSVDELPNPSGLCPKLNINWDAADRKDRVPPVEDRVCYYMTRWYDYQYRDPKKQWKSQFSHNKLDDWNIEILWRNKLIFTMHVDEHHIKNDVPFFMFRQNLTLMKTMGQQKFWFFAMFYMAETEKFCEFFDPSVTHPLLLDWGDQEMQIDVHLPIVAKWRFIDISQHTRPVPILVPLEGMRHFSPLKEVTSNDIPWSEKRNEAIWRGDLSGIVEGKFYYHLDNYQNNTLETCLHFPRCRLVYKNQKTPRADIGFATCSEKAFHTIKGVPMMRPKVPMKEQLQHKMLISIEGNDVASGLKWNLLSNSVVLMPPPAKTIFTMEGLLEPYVHYVPLDIDHVEDAIQWVLDHDEEAQRIAQRSTNFIHDLMMHPDAQKDNDAVLQQIADRISALWN